MTIETATAIAHHPDAHAPHATMTEIVHAHAARDREAHHWRLIAMCPVDVTCRGAAQIVEAGRRADWAGIVTGETDRGNPLGGENGPGLHHRLLLRGDRR